MIYHLEATDHLASLRVVPLAQDRRSNNNSYAASMAPWNLIIRYIMAADVSVLSAPNTGLSTC